MISMVSGYTSPVGVPPTVTSITNVSSTGFTLYWTSASITGLSSGSSYFISYDITVSGPGGMFKTTNSTSIVISGLHPATYYTIKIQTHAQIIGGIESVTFSPVMTSVTTSNETIPAINTVSTDYTQQSSKNVILKAKTRIVLANGFHYRATDGYSLVTQLLPNAKSSNAVEGYTVYPESYTLEENKETVNLNNSSVTTEYEIMQSQRRSLLIRNKNFNYHTASKSGNFEIVEINSGKIAEKGILSGYETNIDISDLRSGFYVVKIRDGENIYTQKIVIRN